MKEATIGMDLGDRRHAVCVLSEDGRVIEERTVVNDRNSIGEWIIRYKGATVAMETGTHSPWVSRFLEELGMKGYVANARKVRAIWSSDPKRSIRRYGQAIAYHQGGQYPVTLSAG